MGSKVTLEQLKNIAISRGGVCISENYINPETPMLWECKEGHRWESSSHNVKNKSRWCPICGYKSAADKRRGNIEELIAIAKKHGGRCVSKNYLGISSPLLWECGKGHIWKATPNMIKNKGTWCPKCSYERAGQYKRLDLREFQNIAKLRGGKCLSDKYINSQTKLLWECERGHRWYARPACIKRGNWCPYCSHTVKLGIEKLKDFAESKGGKCLSSTYVNSVSKLEWECSEGHRWVASASNVLRKTWCPVCANNNLGKNLRLGIEEMQRIASERGGSCLSKEYKNNATPLLWECSEGHKWSAPAASIKGQKTWCPICSQGRGERISRILFERIFNKKFIKVRPYWLTSTKGVRLELDGYCKVLNTAFEYQGEQHYKENTFHNIHKNQTQAGNSLQLLKQRDEVKKELCKQRGIVLIEIPYWIDLDKLQVFIRQKINENNLSKFVVNNNDIDLCALELFDRNELSNLNIIAHQRGGRCLSTTYYGTSNNLTWECGNHHIWKATPSSIKNGSWCGICAGTVRTRTIEDMIRFAKQKNGDCLSKTYESAHQKLLWKCEKGHLWEANFHHIIHGGWCPVCAGKYPITIEEARNIAISRNGKCLSEKYVSGQKLLWECEKGHRWEALIINVKNKHSWCPYCIGNKKTIDDMRSFAKLKGGKCISNEYKGRHVKLTWECKYGHRWSATPNIVSTQGSWCPVCARSRNLAKDNEVNIQSKTNVD